MLHTGNMHQWVQFLILFFRRHDYCRLDAGISVSILTLLRQTDVPYVVTKSLSGAKPTYCMSLLKGFFKYSRKNLSATCVKNFKSLALQEAVTLRDWILAKYWKSFFFSTVMHRIFKKLRRYFPIPLGVRGLRNSH